MLARVAGSLYWMARYLERAEFTARLVGLQIQRLPVGTAAEVATGWRLLFAGIGNEPPESESLGNMEDDDFLFVDGYTLTDPNGGAILVVAAADSPNRPSSSYTQEKPEQEYTYAAYACGAETAPAPDEAAAGEEEAATGAEEQPAEAEAPAAEPVAKTCRKYVLYSWLETVEFVNIPYEKSNFHNLD